MEPMTHLISLSVGTHGGEQHAEVFDGVTNYAKLLDAQCDYVSVSSQLVGDDEEESTDETDDFDCAFEHLIYTEDTLFKVRDALYKGLYGKIDLDLIDQYVMDQITKLQNAGILFRERGPASEEETS